jgi:hypothetical protein
MVTGESGCTNWDAGEANNAYAGGFGTSNDSFPKGFILKPAHWNDLPDYSGIVTPAFRSSGMGHRQLECTTPPEHGWRWPRDGNANDIRGGSNWDFTGDKIEQRFGFDGVDDYVRVPVNLIFIRAWFANC